jgi:hypothetical protein
MRSPAREQVGEWVDDQMVDEGKGGDSKASKMKYNAV